MKVVSPFGYAVQIISQLVSSCSWHWSQPIPNLAFQNQCTPSPGQYWLHFPPGGGVSILTSAMESQFVTFYAGQEVLFKALGD